MSEGIIDLARRLKAAMEAAKITGLDLPGMSVVVDANVGPSAGYWQVTTEIDWVSRPASSWDRGQWQIETSADLTDGSNE